MNRVVLSFRGVFAGYVLLACSFAFAGQSASAPANRVTNLTDGQTLRYSTPLLAGTLADANLAAVTVTNTSSARATREMAGLAHKGRFKALTELVPGENKLVIQAGTEQLNLTLNYRPQTNPYVVRAIYWTDKTGDANFQTPIANDPQDYRGKLDTAMKLMQSFTAERMNDLGFGRVTFNLELDANGMVNVHVMRGSKAAAEYAAVPDQNWYSLAAGEVGRKLPNPLAHNLVIPAYTRFDANTQKVYAHTALGGGNLALFGGGDLFAWPDNLQQAQRAFMDANQVDPRKFFSDSVGRHTYWAIASTTIGAALHELGHTFGLPHSVDNEDIMTRGIDRFNRFFTFADPPHARRKQAYEFKDTEIGWWAPASAAMLAPCRFFALDARDWSEAKKTEFHLSDDGNSIVIESPNGLAGVTVNRVNEHGTEAFYPLAINRAAPPNRLAVNIAELARPRLPQANLALHVIDTQGLSSRIRLSELSAGPYVQDWQFASLTAPWNDTGRFVPVDANRLAEIEASAATTKLAHSHSTFVDFLALCPTKKNSNVVGYAFRTIRCDSPRIVKIYTGSDDALRVWVNGKCVTQALALRGAVPDSECHSAELIKGDNRLLVEVSQFGGGWGLYLRLEDDKGNHLRLKDDGTLAPTK